MVVLCRLKMSIHETERVTHHSNNFVVLKIARFHISLKLTSCKVFFSIYSLSRAELLLHTLCPRHCCGHPEFIQFRYNSKWLTLTTTQQISQLSDSIEWSIRQLINILDASVVCIIKPRVKVYKGWIPWSSSSFTLLPIDRNKSYRKRERNSSLIA